MVWFWLRACRSTSEVQKGRSRILLYLFLTGAVAALVVGIVFATVTYIKSHVSADAQGTQKNIRYVAPVNCASDA